ncbi:hypothetical protein ES703_115424 [subsurface metagenome]
MNPADRFKSWIESLSDAWKERLSGWMVSWAVKGITDALEDMTPEQKASLDTVSKRIIDRPDISTDLKDMLVQMGMKGNPLATFVKMWILGGWLTDLIRSMVAPKGTKLGYVGQREFEPYRLDPLYVITAWRRDPEKYAHLFDDLKDLGWDDDRLEALKFYTLFMPTASDIVSWYAREVYEPDMITKYGLDSELPNYAETDFPKIGVDEKQATNYWRAHWVHASWMQIVEMLHRGLIAEADVYEWFRLVEIPPYWRELLIKTAYTWPTRVDVRRWWDMRTIDEAKLRDIYHRQGYYGEDLDLYVLWTKVYVAFPDLIARWKNGWLTEDDVRNELKTLGMPDDRVEEMIQTKIKPAQPERVEGERDLTKAEVYAGVKKEVISWDEGLELLQDMGYGAEEAEFILEVRVGVAEGSPDTFTEFKRWTQEWS